MIYIVAVLVALVGYFIGSISGAILISKGVHGDDIRNSGSKNAGTTNMLRVYGKKAAVVTLLIDVLKGVIAVLVGILVDYFVRNSIETVNPLLNSMKYIAGIFAVIGHDFPVFFGFKGGKGVATSLGVILTLDWKIGLIVMIASLIIMAVSRYVSLGSIAAAVIYPCLVAVVMLVEGDFILIPILSSVVMAVLVIVKHRSNIERLTSGTENKLFEKKK
ncbi:MAG: glycerol-3-phosphate 1-O-acyltransferase PlsY [Clostridia bacterium]|nr:glycerol-3-phosphate 1-O-acyltransferase PlsY [Clostridia bacterium]